MVSSKQKLYDYSPLSVAKSEQVTLMWDMIIMNDKCLERNCPDILFVYKSGYEWIVKDILVPWDETNRSKYEVPNHDRENKTQRNIPSNSSNSSFDGWHTCDYFQESSTWLDNFDT